MGRNSRRKQAARELKASGKKEQILGYILYQPEHDDFLSFFKGSEDMVQAGWCSHPSGAKVFPSESVAKQVAKNWVKDKYCGYELKICKLVDTPDEYRVEEIEKIVNDE